VEHPNDANTYQEVTYNFNPGDSGDVFLWGKSGNVGTLVVSAKYFTVRGVHKRIMPTAVSYPREDWEHMVVATSSTCSTSLPNLPHSVIVPAYQNWGEANFDFTFAFPKNSGPDFHIYVRDHDCAVKSNVITRYNVAGEGETYDNIGTLTIVYT
jgi:hypothetical protein